MIEFRFGVREGPFWAAPFAGQKDLADSPTAAVGELRGPPARPKSESENEFGDAKVNEDATDVVACGDERTCGKRRIDFELVEH